MPHKKAKGVPKAVVIIIFSTVIFLIIISVSPFIVSGKVDAVPDSFYFAQNSGADLGSCSNCIFSVLTLNIGHGRGTGLHQLFQSRKKITTNADIVADVIRKENITITALQEVDGPGFWNGGLDMIEHLAEYSGYSHGIWTKNVDTPALRYGTALLSSLPYSTAESYTFKARPIVLPKGFTVGVFRISKDDDRHICVVSVHLAPVLKIMRKKQIEILIRTLKDYDYPMIIMGDFNCGWSKNSAVKMLADSMDLKVWQPESKTLATREPANRRLDWILISKEFDFISCGNLPDRLSDHSAVKAEIRLRND